MSEVSHSDFNIFKAKAISRGKLIDRFRDRVIHITDNMQDEGDRVYFGSTNDADDLREVVRAMDAMKWDRIIRERPEVDPYAELRALRRRSEDLIEALDACEDYFDNRADADCDQDGYIPNPEMRLLQVVREALRKAGA